MSGSAPSTPSPGAYPAPLFRLAGDQGLIVEFGDALDERINNAVIAFDARLKAAAPPGVIETAPTIRSVLVRFDPLETPFATMRARLTELLEERDWLKAEPPPGRLWRIPARYGGEEGPDLAATAGLLGVSETEAVEAHAACRQRVFMLGFSPGFAYMGRLPERWALPRLEQVKPRVPTGSISVAVRQTVLCATPIPTGWRTIARTPFLSFDLTREPPFLLEAGDRIEFEPVSGAVYTRLCERAATGAPVAECESLS